MKILILTPIWHRSEITKIWAAGLKHFLTDNVTVLTILSREDESFNQNFEIIHNSGFKYCYFNNNPLGQKLNAGIEYALETFDFDYMMNLGSDDLIHPGIWSLYKSCLDSKCQFFGLEKVYFYEKKTGKLGLSKPYVWGAGRLISREILEKIRLKGDFLYKNEFSRGLDCNSIDKIKLLLNIDYKQVETNDFPYLVDIKVDDALSDFTLLQRHYDLVDSDILRQYYPKSIINQL